MAFDGDGAAANGFGRRSFHLWEARLLYEANYPAPPDFRGPLRWRLSAGGVYIPPLPLAADMDDHIAAVLAGMTDEQRALPQHFPENYDAWSAYFLRRYENEMAAYEGPPPRNNAEGRRRWWSVPGRTLPAVLDHIEAGNTPVLRMPPRLFVDATAHGIYVVFFGLGLALVRRNCAACHAEETLPPSEGRARQHSAQPTWTRRWRDRHTGEA